jgi:hypothetical protein
MASAVPVSAQAPLTGAIRVVAVFNSRLKLTFDRTSVVFDTEAYDINTVVPVDATPLIVSAKARVAPNTRIVMTVKADGPFTSGAATIPVNKLTWTTSGPGFQSGGTANDNAAKMMGSWRGSGSWTGTQVYQFLDSWDYTVGVYTVTMLYTISAP